jgi:hypothetical protein
MRLLFVPLLIVGCLLALVGACFGPVLWSDKQFAYRDAAHFYYPLYQRVQQEWDAHRWPLWEPEENGGTPLLGNPTAAVLYPGKVIYHLFPYPWAARFYVVAHSLLAFVGMLVLMRWWEVGWTGSAIAALAYAFGAPVLFQYCNVIFLVGAAWTPLGFRAIDRLVRSGRRWGLLELAIVLVMQTLGGDPQSAYLTLLCGAGYVLGLALAARPERRMRWGLWIPVAVLIAAAWIAGTLAVAHAILKYRPSLESSNWLAWRPYGQVLLLAFWGVAGLVVACRGRGIWGQQGLGRRLVSLGCAGALAAGIGAAQLLPVFEFAGLSLRAAEESPHDVFPFSLEPHRAIELIWPNVYGTTFGGNRYWLSLIPPRHTPEVWIPSLYLGGLTLVLALAAVGFRNGPTWRGWMTAVAVLSFVASMGTFGSPLWWARAVPGWQAYLGPHDPVLNAPPRNDGSLQDGDGSFYWLLANALPGFGAFRYPSKLTNLTALALAALAGLGWEQLVARANWRAAVWGSMLLAVSSSALASALALRPRILAVFEVGRAGQAGSIFGPLDAAGSANVLLRALAHGTVVLLIALAIALTARRRPRLAGSLALIVLTADLAVANSELVLSLPQAVFETEPRVLTVIKEAERANPSPGPFRVHRMPVWNPAGWANTSSDDRFSELVVWERNTLQPKYAIPYHVEYTLTEGTTELYDYRWFFGGFFMHYNPNRAALPGALPGQEITCYPRRGFDMWNTRYFILPLFTNNWRDALRGYASFLPDTETVEPKPTEFEGPDGKKRFTHWVATEDWQVLRNKNAFPRAWIVHSARRLEPIRGLSKAARKGPMEDMLFQNDAFWHDSDRTVYDPRSMVWIETDDLTTLADYLPRTPPDAAESVTITAYEPRRVELTAVLNRPGLVVLADVYYPGWRLTIDGVPSTILRANRLMRGAAVKSGTHHLVYTYQPASFRIGWRLSIASLGVFALLAIWVTLRPMAREMPTGEPVAALMPEP